MITAMNKYLFLIYHREYESFLEKLRNTGVVHIQETKATKDVAELQNLLLLRKGIAETMRMLAPYKSENAPAQTTTPVVTETAGEQAVKDVQHLFAEEVRLKNAIVAKKREIEQMELWGQFDFSSIARLSSAGYEMNFYASSVSAYKPEWAEIYGAIEINTVRSTVYFVTVGHKHDPKPDAERIKLPDYDLSTLYKQQEALEAELQANAAAKTAFADNRMGELTAYDMLMADKFAFTNAMVQAEGQADDKLMLLEGWVPTADAAPMEQAIAAEGYYIEKMEIKEEDSVPIKLKNNAFARLFEPITKMYSMPNYSELDPTPLLAPFFMLFFALCFGDGGYGLLLFVIATIAKIKSDSGAIKSLCGMLQWLGGTTAVVGSLMGTVFGMVMPWAGDDLLGSVRNDYFLNQDNMMKLSVVLGLLQIIFAKYVAGYKTQIQKGFKYALATYAWATFILFGALSFVIKPLAESKPELGVVALAFTGITGLALLIALFYNSPGKNIFMNFGAGLWATYNTASGLLGDTLSYIRLFAIGLTGGILGGVFNNLAVQIGGGLPTGLNFLVMAIILLFGHGLNIGLCMISSLVHPIRLTFVEFYKNSEFEGGGNEYTPFKRS